MSAPQDQPAMSRSGLSPAARAALDGFRASASLNDGLSLAGALRALANHQRRAWDPETNPRMDHWMPTAHTRRELLNIASELDEVT